MDLDGLSEVRAFQSWEGPCLWIQSRVATALLRLDASTTLPAATKISRVLRSFWKREVQRTLGSGPKTLSRS